MGMWSLCWNSWRKQRRSGADPLVLIEQRLDFSCYVPDGFGTGDCLIVADKLLHIIDFKYGQGVLVDTEGESPDDAVTPWAPSGSSTTSTTSPRSP